MQLNSIKLIIWDLDNTLWTGTLGEEKIQVSRKSIRLIERLAKRGILSSICSKGIFEDSQRILKEHEIWNLFISPSIDYSPKGARIVRLIKQLQLRAENVLFIDDEAHNREEVRVVCPKINVADPKNIIPKLLGGYSSLGIADPKLTKLSQYKHLVKKLGARSRSKSNNIDFLKKSKIRIHIEYDIDAHIERVIELINRSNQLNFTKKRLVTTEDRRKFKQSLKLYGAHAGAIFVSDRYGDYGLAGFFKLDVSAQSKTLEHFVFSCRIMNMGVEQFLFGFLKRPECKITGPVASSLSHPARVDWIKFKLNSNQARPANIVNTCLLGGCDLMQMSLYLPTGVKEWVNTVKGQTLVRYDDAGFILSSRRKASRSKPFRKLDCWSASEANSFDRNLLTAQNIILAMGMAMAGDYAFLEEDFFIRLSPDEFGDNVAKQILQHFGSLKILKMTTEEKLSLITRGLKRIEMLSPRAKKRILLGANTRKLGKKELALSQAYNRFASSYCKNNRSYSFIDVDTIVPKNEILENRHFSRLGYFLLAQEIQRVLKQT